MTLSELKEAVDKTIAANPKDGELRVMTSQPRSIAWAQKIASNTIGMDEFVFVLQTAY
jgi:hypothetical protein